MDYMEAVSGLKSNAILVLRYWLGAIVAKLTWLSLHLQRVHQFHLLFDQLFIIQVHCILRSLILEGHYLLGHLVLFINDCFITIFGAVL